MAAYIVAPSRKDWDVISRFLGDCREGAIVVPPHVADRFKEKYGKEVPEGDLVEYDYGGEAQILIDVMHGLDHFSARPVREAVGVEEEED